MSSILFARLAEPINFVLRSFLMPCYDFVMTLLGLVEQSPRALLVRNFESLILPIEMEGVTAPEMVVLLSK